MCLRSMWQEIGSGSNMLCFRSFSMESICCLFSIPSIFILAEMPPGNQCILYLFAGEQQKLRPARIYAGWSELLPFTSDFLSFRNGID